MSRGRGSGREAVPGGGASWSLSVSSEWKEQEGGGAESGWEARRQGLPAVTCPCSTEFKKFLLYARQMEIRGVDLDAPYYNYIISYTVPDIDNVTVLDYDAREQRVYWSDVRTQAIKRAFINGTGVETVVSAGSNPAPADPVGVGVPLPALAPRAHFPSPGPRSTPTWFSDPCSCRNQAAHLLPTSAPHTPTTVSPLCPQTCQTPTGWLWTGCPGTCSGPATTPTRSRLTWPGWMAPSRTLWCRAWSSPMAWLSTHSAGGFRAWGSGV